MRKKIEPITFVLLILFVSIGVLMGCQPSKQNGTALNSGEAKAGEQRSNEKAAKNESGSTIDKDVAGDVPAVDPVVRVQRESTCECQDPADQDIVDLEEESLPPFSEREIKPGVRMAVGDADEALEVFFGNLHSHTAYSDGSGLPGEAFLHARENGELDFLALTEHNHKQAGSENGMRIATNNERYVGPGSEALIPVANGMTETGVFVAIFGQEFSSIGSGNHANVFDVPKVIDEEEVLNGDFASLLDSWLPNNLDSSGKQGLLQLNHPWNGSSPNNIEYGRDDYDDFETWRSKLDQQAQLIEVINGPSHSSASGVKPTTVSASEFRRYLGMGFHLAPTANQDNHFETWGTITDARTGVIAGELSKSSILDALRNRHAYASLDKNLRLIAKVQGKLVGSIITDAVASGTELSINISINDDDEPVATYWVEIFADNVQGESATSRAKLVETYGPFETVQGVNNTWDIDGLEYGEWDYLYMKVSRGDANSPDEMAYMAPVWFESE